MNETYNYIISGNMVTPNSELPAHDSVVELDHPNGDVTYIRASQITRIAFCRDECKYFVVAKSWWIGKRVTLPSALAAVDALRKLCREDRAQLAPKEGEE